MADVERLGKQTLLEKGTARSVSKVSASLYEDGSQIFWALVIYKMLRKGDS